MKTNQYCNKIIAKLERMSYFKFVLVQFLLMFAFLVMEGAAYYAAMKIFAVEYNDSSINGSFIKVSLLFLYAAISETFIFQFLPYKIINFFYEEKPNGITTVTLYITVSSFMFGLGHLFINLPVSIIIRFIRAFFKCVGPGIILSYTYYVADKNKWKPFWTVSLLHFIFNLTLLILE